MKLLIHRGADEIGGSCIEIQNAAGEILLLDIGLPLSENAECSKEFLPQSLDLEQKNILGILLSHAHKDHYGLLKFALEKQIPAYLSEPSIQIINEAAAWHLPDALGLPENLTHTIKPKKTLPLGNFQITAYEVDHSAYGALAFLIEADGKRIFYTGDFRSHGNAQYKTAQLLNESALKAVDVLLLEGTTIANNNTHRFVSEKELTTELINYFQDCRGLALVSCSGQNIDRIVDLIKVANKLRRKLVLDPYSYYTAKCINNRAITGALKDVLVYIPYWNRLKIKWADDQQLFHKINLIRQQRIYPEDLAKNHVNYLLLLRFHVMNDLEHNNIPLTNAKFAYSLWSGYFAKDQKLQEFLKKHNIQNKIIHTSGHADIETLQELVKALAPGKLIPIHTEHPEYYQQHFADITNVCQIPNGKFLEI